ncbi:MAG TPA: glycine cleavage system protein H [Anaeromyxobacteraceae bacterium]|nr:glycine cleavage system protein H [Anaeromyxobacteraceae bacterium]
MQAIVQLLETAGLFLVGLLARAGLVLGVILLLAVPVVLIALGLRGAESLRHRRLGVRHVAGLLFRPDLWYAPGHAWLGRRKGGALVVGLDDLAQRLMPSVTGVEVPRAGTAVAQGAPLCTLFAGARRLVVPSPVAGTVACANPAVLRDPGLVKRDGYGRGWLVAVTPADERYAALPRGDGAEAFLRREAARWNRLVEEELGLAAADGGELLAPAPYLLGEAGWRRLVREVVGGC